MQENNFNNQQNYFSEPPQPQEPPQAQFSQKSPKDKKEFAITSFIFGFLSFIPFLGFITAIVGIIFGVMGMESSKRKLAIAGIVLCALFPITMGITSSFILINLRNAQQKSTNTDIESTTKTMTQLKSAAEVFYSEKGSYVGLDKDADFSTIRNNFEEKSKFSELYTGNESYCYSSFVPGNRLTFWCIDSRGVSKEYNNQPPCSAQHIACD